MGVDRENGWVPTFKRPGHIGSAPSHPKQTLREVVLSRAHMNSRQGAYDDDEEIDDLSWVPFDVQNERVRDAGWRGKDDDDLILA